MTRILVVEDSQTQAMKLRFTLESEGFEVETAERIREALARLGQGGIDMILLDLTLPDSYGFEGFVKIRSRFPAVPVVVLTGMDDESLAVRAVQEGAQDYLVKGQADGKVLTRSIRCAIQRHATQVEQLSRAAPTSTSTSDAGFGLPAPMPAATAFGGSSAQAGSGTFAPEGDPTALFGTRLGNYVIRGVLGRGGMGVVYEAENTLLERRAAVKLLPQWMASDQKSLGRFLLEAKAAAKLEHPNVVGVYDVGQVGHSYFIAMQLVRGASAQDRMKKSGKLPVREATRVAADACRGLAAAHAVGIVHRDMKPSNIMIGNDGVAKVVDFGLAKAHDTTGLTRSGVFMGTPDFVSPEQADPTKSVDFRSDLYSLGATYFAMLAGEAPYKGSEVAVIFGHCFQPVPDIRATDPSIPEPCSALIRKAMAKDPAERYQTAGEMLAALESVLPGLP